VTWTEVRNSPWLAAVLTLALGLGISIQLATLDIERQSSGERAMVVNGLAAVRAQLEGVVKATFNSTDGLVNLVTLKEGIEPALFADMARLAIGKNRHIRNITLAPDDVVTQVYPLPGNESVLGFRYETRPEQYRTVRLARESQQPLLIGPVALVQGGAGLINRAPVFVQRGDGKRYWGVISIVATIDGLLAAGGLDTGRNIRVALRGKDGRGKDGEPIGGDPALFAQNPVLATVPIPGGEWQLAAVPARGWTRRSVAESNYFLFGIVNTLLLTAVIALLARRSQQTRQSHAKLEQEVRERQKIAQALIEEESRFRALFECSPDPVWIIQNNLFVECNEAAVRMLGYQSKSEFLFTHPSQLSPERQPDGEPSFLKAERLLEEVRQTGIIRFEWQHLRAGGEEFTAEVTLSTITLQGAEAVYCVWRDVSERKRIDDALRANQKLLEAILESAGAVIYVYDVDGRLMLCNARFEQAIGLERELMIGKRRAEFMPPALASYNDEMDRTVIEERTRISYEEDSQQADGSHHYLTVKCPVLEGGEIRAVVGISTDISDRKLDEQRLHLAATIISTTTEGVAVTDAAGKVVSVNRAFTEITGYEEHEVLGKNPRMLKSERHDPDFYQAMWTALAEAGAWQGEIWNRRKNGEIYPEWLSITVIKNVRGEVVNYVAVFSDISSLKRSQEQLERLAHFDPLTELPNRVLFQDRLAHAIDRATRYRHLLAVLLLDLDGFKNVNDGLGHPVGDRLLQQVAHRLKGCVRVEDTVSRLGGDEFALIIANMREGGDAIEVVRKILASIQEPFDLDGMSASVTASIGVAIYPGDGATPTDLVRNADAAMYGAKEAGRNVYRFYQASMTQRAQERLQHERALRRGIEQREFEVWFQPQVSLISGKVTGAEALVRWRDPVRGLVPPAEFIPLAESTGLIVPLGNQILEQVCAHARRWLDAGLPFGRLAINVAAPQIDRSDMVQTIREALLAAGTPPSRIEIEITESSIMQNALHTREVLEAVQALGITTSIDDFGTGYSSLAYLKELPIDNLKIDRAFVKGLPDDHNDVAITRAIIAMAHSLEFKVIAEGIETEAQRVFLLAEGCDEGQGYFIGRPLPAAEFEEWLRQHQGRARFGIAAT
jgi:diguanylate cyclase (GGDEF)-like protein/PAS domain S-box-containing protein